MSVSLILVPLAVAAVAAIQGTRGGRDADGRIICEVRTRMRDAELLCAALRSTGAGVSTDDTAGIQAHWQSVHAVFQHGADGVWSAHFSGDVDEQRAIDIVQTVDEAYGREVQAAVLRRLRERAPAAGLRLESETVGDDQSVRLVFQVEGRS